MRRNLRNQMLGVAIACFLFGSVHAQQIAGSAERGGVFTLRSHSLASGPLGEGRTRSLAGLFYETANGRVTLSATFSAIIDLKSWWSKPKMVDWVPVKVYIHMTGQKFTLHL